MAEGEPGTDKEHQEFVESELGAAEQQGKQDAAEDQKQTNSAGAGEDERLPLGDICQVYRLVEHGIERIENLLYAHWIEEESGDRE